MSSSDQGGRKVGVSEGSEAATQPGRAGEKGGNGERGGGAKGSADSAL